MQATLRAAGAYNLLWGAWTVLFPLAAFRVIGADLPNYPSLWQCVGMVVGVYGLAYWLAAEDPIRHYPVVAAGFIGKLCGVVGFSWSCWHGELPLSFGLINLTNDAVWLPLFYLILRHIYQHSAAERLQTAPKDTNSLEEFLNRYPANPGQILTSLSQNTPVLVVFLRHLGCLFCREMLSDLARQRPALEAAGIRIAIVHQANEAQAGLMFRRYGLENLPRISDPTRELYAAFGLGTGGWREIVGWRNWPRALLALLFGGHLQLSVWGGRASQLSGVFLLYDGRIVMDFRHASAGQRFDFQSALAVEPDS